MPDITAALEFIISKEDFIRRAEECFEQLQYGAEFSITENDKKIARLVPAGGNNDIDINAILDMFPENDKLNL